MVIHKATVTADRIWIARGAFGFTLQEVVGEYDGGLLTLTCGRIQQPKGQARLDSGEALSLAKWLGEIAERMGGNALSDGPPRFAMDADGLNRESGR